MSLSGRHNVVPLRRRDSGPWVTPQGLADHFGVSLRTVQRWKAEGLPCLERRSIVRFQVTDAEEWLQGAAG